MAIFILLTIILQDFSSKHLYHIFTLIFPYTSVSGLLEFLRTSDKSDSMYSNTNTNPVPWGNTSINRTTWLNKRNWHLEELSASVELHIDTVRAAAWTSGSWTKVHKVVWKVCSVCTAPFLGGVEGWGCGGGAEHLLIRRTSLKITSVSGAYLPKYCYYYTPSISWNKGWIGKSSTPTVNTTLGPQ